MKLSVVNAPMKVLSKGPHMSNHPLKVLCIGSNECDFILLRELIQKAQIRRAGMQWISDSVRGMEILLKNRHDVCIVDSKLGQENALVLLRRAARSGCITPLILFSQKRDHVFDVKAMKAGASDFLIKSEISPSLFERSIRYSMAHKKEERALRTSKQSQQVANIKLEKAMQSINEELEMAGKVQESMLPRDTTEINGLTIATAYLPCGRVGGDLYDIIRIDETRACFLMCDVVGHGVPAALISAMVKVSFTKNITREVSTAQIMERVNKEIVSFFKEKRHITAFIAIYDNTTRELVFTGGGHPSPIVMHPNEQKLEYLSSRGIPLGMFGDIKYEVSRTHLNSGDCIVFYTDGLTESHNANDSLFGKKRLEVILTGLAPESSANDVLGAIIKGQFSFIGNVERSDDITLVIVKIP
jgi:phosphoserine phosphatase RsbU/P